MGSRNDEDTIETVCVFSRSWICSYNGEWENLHEEIQGDFEGEQVWCVSSSSFLWSIVVVTAVTGLTGSRDASGSSGQQFHFSEEAWEEAGTCLRETGKRCLQPHQWDQFPTVSDHKFLSSWVLGTELYWGCYTSSINLSASRLCLPPPSCQGREGGSESRGWKKGRRKWTQYWCVSSSEDTQRMNLCGGGYNPSSSHGVQAERISWYK